MQASVHLQARINSARMAFQQGYAKKIIICGGTCFHIRYPTHLEQPSIKPPDFTPKARRKASRLPSESAVIGMMLNKAHDSYDPVPWDNMILEQKSLTTSGNAKESSKLIKELRGGSTGILSMVYHLNRPRENTMEVFEYEFAKRNLSKPIPVYTEEILYCHRRNNETLSWIRRFYSDYSLKNSWSGFQWDAEEICRRLTTNTSLMDLKPIKAIE